MTAEEEIELQQLRNKKASNGWFSSEENQRKKYLEKKKYYAKHKPHINVDNLNPPVRGGKKPIKD